MLEWVQMGYRHIANWDGYDHLLFIVALSAIHTVREWRQLLVLVTAFTVGHSLSLALATLGWVRFNSAWVEVLIPTTILATCLLNLWNGGHIRKWKGLPLQYPLTLLFGLVHGLSFSSFLGGIVEGQGHLAVKLLGFNLGLEAGQLVIVSGAVAAGFIALEGFHLSKTVWNWIISGITGGFAIYLLIQKMLVAG